MLFGEAWFGAADETIKNRLAAIEDGEFDIFLEGNVWPCWERTNRGSGRRPGAGEHENDRVTACGDALTRESANKAFDHFLEKYHAKYQAACDCLKKDRDVLQSFYDFPAEHWGHLRTTNPIESTFATIRLRHRRTKGSGTRKASLTMMFKLAQAAQKRWRRLNKHELILPLIQGKVFTDGIVQDAA